MCTSLIIPLRHIAVNAAFLAQPNVGSGQYLHGLLAGFRATAPALNVTLLVPAAVQAALPIPPPYPMVGVPTPFDQLNAHAAKLWFEQIGAPAAAKRCGADILHVPYFGPPLRASLPVVVSVLDLIPLILPEYRGGRAVQLYMRLAATATRRAKEVITISHASAADIVRHLRYDPTRVSVTHLAAGAQYAPQNRAAAQAAVAQRFGITGPFIYYVGGLDARKNVATLIRAFGILQRTGGPPATLVLAGRALGHDSQLFPDLDAIIAEQQLGAAIQRIDVSAADGPLFYNAATVVAAPSRYEGFGLPPLEAMACGTPVVCSNASSHPEVVGDAALLVPPDDQHAWCAALWRVLADAPLRAELTQRGLARALQFSYARCAQQTLQVYQRALT